MNTQHTNGNTASTVIESTTATQHSEPPAKKGSSMKSIVKLLAIAALGVALGVASAKPWSSVSTVKDRLTQSVGGKIPIDAVRETPAPGLFEVQSGGDIFYSDATGKFVILDGRLMDLDRKLDLTKASIDKASAINFGTDLPLQLAIKEVKGNG
jgi:thiol:disulfide interchange protein DsbC